MRREAKTGVWPSFPFCLSILFYSTLSNLPHRICICISCCFLWELRLQWIGRERWRMDGFNRESSEYKKQKHTRHATSIRPSRPLWILKRPTSRSFSLSLLSQAAGNHVAHTRTYTIPLVVLRVSSWVTREKKFWGTGHLTVQSSLISIAVFSRSIGTLAWLSPDRVRCFCFLALYGITNQGKRTFDLVSVWW